MATTDRRGVTVDSTDSPLAANPNPGLAIKVPCRASTLQYITLSGLQTIDDVSLVAGDRVLVRNNTDATTNGIYVVSAGLWTRAQDANNNTQFAVGMLIYVSEGTANAHKLFVLSAASPNPVVLGTSTLTFGKSVQLS